VKPDSLRSQLWFVGFGYAAVFLVSAVIILARYLQEHFHRAEMTASGGMSAFGDLVLAIFILCLFMIPTVFLMRIMAQYATAYTTYSQFLLGLSLSAPVCLSLFVYGQNHVSDNLRVACLARLIGSPLVFVGIGASRFLARFPQAKRLTSYALVIEGLTLGIAIAMWLRS
jgi:hypothetical protein